MSDIEPKKLEAFLKDYQKIVKKHQLAISACGCCQSPWVCKIDSLGNFHSDRPPLEDHLEHLKENS